MLRGPQMKENSDLDFVSKNTNYIKCFKMHQTALYLPLMQENSFESSVKCQRDTLWILWELWKVIKRQQCKSSNQHWLPSIRPFPAPLVKDHQSRGQFTIPWITLYFYHWFYDSTSTVCLPAEFRQHSSEAEEARNDAEATIFHTPDSWPRQSSGKRTPPSSAWAVRNARYLSPVLERWWQPHPQERCSAQGATLFCSPLHWKSGHTGTPWARANRR